MTIRINVTDKRPNAADASYWLEVGEDWTPHHIQRYHDAPNATITDDSTGQVCPLDVPLADGVHVTIT